MTTDENTCVRNDNARGGQCCQPYGVGVIFELRVAPTDPVRYQSVPTRIGTLRTWKYRSRVMRMTPLDADTQAE